MTKEIALVVLDWTLTDGQGINWTKKIREDKFTIPIIMLIMLIDRIEFIDKILGLETGANDYITKPFEVRELMARIRVQLRFQPVESNSDGIIIQKITDRCHCRNEIL